MLLIEVKLLKVPRHHDGDCIIEMERQWKVRYFKFERNFLNQIDVDMRLHSEDSLKTRSLITKPSLETLKFCKIFINIISRFNMILIILILVKFFLLLLNS
jgi:hypothetical protein